MNATSLSGDVAGKRNIGTHKDHSNDKNTVMIKIIYIAIIILYIGIIGGWCYRFTISFKIVGSDPDLIDNRDLTNEEFDRIDKSYYIRQIISSILIYSSLIVCIGSCLILRNDLLEPRLMLKIVIGISGSIAFFLILVNGINFIPGAPIR
jgi:hypothetical protein